ncbi:hypothetical protein G6O69_31270 [Pseudenhygromyxa sp. WMMC2535]|uniref:hypothetical protein n=1 Tax=Pseudenhygromyxa sp. WMMC2535 TaxID=2712867 RepID=UPI001552E116|nr:hypothetical protein [Pseudenhygromyxa sp. WMMC2535]NVB42345.1 hypothetical protein [Pseudenhygromyxa sp. WMMC2535]
MTKTTRTFTLTLTCAFALGAIAGGCVAEADASEGMANLDDATLVRAQPLDALPDQLLDEAIVDGSCTLEARPAAIVSVSHQVGDEVSPQPAKVLWRHLGEDGWGEVHEAFCIDEACTRFSLGHGQSGMFAVGAFSCDAEQLQLIEVGMTDDDCHVDTVEMSMNLGELAPACMGQGAVERGDSLGEFTAAVGPRYVGVGQLGERERTPSAPEWITDEREPGVGEPWVTDERARPEGELEIVPPCVGEAQSPAVIASTSIITEGGVAMATSPDAIAISYEGGPEAPMACLDEDCTAFVDGWGDAGIYTVSVEICSEVVTRRVKVVSTDECGEVQTEWVGLFVHEQDCEDDPDESGSEGRS